MSGPGYWVMIRSTRELVAQVETALDQIKAANGGVEPARLRDAHAIAPAAFGKLIEGLVALGAEVDDEMQQLAGLREIGDVI